MGPTRKEGPGFCSRGGHGGLETDVREAGHQGVSCSVPNTHWARTATAAELLEPEWVGEGEEQDWGRALGLTAPGPPHVHPQELPCPCEHGREAAVTW